MPNLKKIVLPPRYNYIACFLTLSCNLKCDYCINYFGQARHTVKGIISGREWVGALNRLEPAVELPITLQGGEPSLHPDFIDIIKGIKEDLNIDILTNLSFNVDNFIKSIKPSRLKRDSPYPSIRVSYHPDYADLGQIINKVLRMQESGFSIGIFGILHPRFQNKILEAQERCCKLGIDFRTKEFLGSFGGKVYGTYLYPGAIVTESKKKCLCRVSELIIGPDGYIYKCHSDLYNGFTPTGNLQDHDCEVEDIFRACDRFGDCNPCDVKVKTDRFQVQGYTSAEVRDIC